MMTEAEEPACIHRGDSLNSGSGNSLAWCLRNKARTVLGTLRQCPISNRFAIHNHIVAISDRNRAASRAFLISSIGRCFTLTPGSLPPLRWEKRTAREGLSDLGAAFRLSRRRDDGVLLVLADQTLREKVFRGVRDGGNILPVILPS